MKLHPKIILYSFLFTVLVQGDDFSLKKDKKLHFGISFIFGVASTTYIENNYKNNYSRKKKILLSTSLAVIPGILKEVMDSKEQNNSFDKADLSYDVLGAFTGSLISSYFYKGININPVQKELSFNLKF